MKHFESIQFDANRCREELYAFRSLLESNHELKEKRILRFLREHVQFAAFIGSINMEVRSIDRFALEFPLFGDFTCDLVVGGSTSLAYCFIEFEDGGPKSVFVQKNRDAPEWAPRFDHGYSQIIDWFWKLADMSRTDEFEHRFGGRSIDYTALLIIGRNTFSAREASRLKWRQQNVVVNSKHINCYTLEDLYEALHRRIQPFIQPG
jgi:Domain of unknown function (DUF4263)